MRFIKKYKVWIKRPDISIPPRILKFKKSKWKPVKKLITTRRIFLSPKKIQKNIHSATKIIWKRLKYRFKNNLLFKTQYKCRFDFSINLKHMEKFYNKHKILTNNILKLEYKIDILLWKLKFFKSTYEARQNIQRGSVLLNDKVINSTNKYLYQGDIIKVVNEKNTHTQITSKKEIRSCFLEVDYYTKTIIIFKNLIMLGTSDITCTVQNPLTDFAINNLIYNK